MNNAILPAYPVEVSYYDNEVIGMQTTNTSGMAKGISKREYFAALALQGLLANPNVDLENCGVAAVIHADEILKALEK
jgi:hypothetical protein